MSSFPAGQWDSKSGAMENCLATTTHLRPAEPEWYALQIKPRSEKKAELQLRAKGIETYLPLVRQVRWWSDRRKIIETPLFAGYEFVRIPLSPTTKLLVLRTSGVTHFV